MKQIFTLALSLFWFFSFAQYESFDQISYFDEFLKAKTIDNNFYYIDSIHQYAGNDKSPVNLYNKFITKEIDSKFNITDGEYYSYNYFNNSFEKLGDLHVKFNSRNNIQSYLFYYNFYNEIDTMRYILNNDKDEILIDQKRDFLYCGTGNPADASKTIITYNDNGDILNKVIKLKWNYESSSYENNDWTDAYKFYYEYENNKVKEIISTMFDIEEKEWFPSFKETYSYDKDSLISYLHQYYNTTDNVYENSYIDYFSDSLGMKVKERYLWGNGNWKPSFRTITTKDFYPQLLLQRWNNDSLKWINEYRNYSKHSGLFDFVNFYVDNWDKANSIWKPGAYSVYQSNGDTITYSYTNSGYYYEEEKMIFKDGKIVESKSYRFQNNKKYIFSTIIFKYDDNNNLIKEENIFYNNPSDSGYNKIIWDYFWHPKDEQNSNKFVNKKNQWNIGFRKDIFGPFYYTKCYKFSTDNIVINNRSYLELLENDYSNNLGWVSTSLFFRESNNKVWRVENGEEYIYYNFSLEKGDTFITNNNEKLLVLLTYNKVMENGELLKAIRLLDLGTMGVTTWYEGIGDSHGLLENNTGAYIDFDWDLLCFLKDQSIVYKNNLVKECLITGTGDIDKQDFKFYPNPANNYLEFDFSNSYLPNYIKIFDLAGKLLIENYFLNNKIDISSLKPGMYIINLSDISGKNINLKFIKTVN